MGSGIGLLVIGASAALTVRMARSVMMPSHIRARMNASINFDEEGTQPIFSSTATLSSV
jgi:hypothetical protein